MAVASVTVPRGAAGGGAGNIVAAALAVVAGCALVAGAIYAAAVIISAAVMMLVAALALAAIVAGTGAAIYGLGCGVRAVWQQLDQVAIEGPLQARVEMYWQADGTVGYRALAPGAPAPGTDPAQVHIVELPAPAKQLGRTVTLTGRTAR